MKKRLIGAIVLVALAVIFLPMLIKGPAPDSGVSDVSTQVPSPPAGQYETRELPLVTPGQPSPEEGVVGMNGAVSPPVVASSPDPAAPSAGSDALPPATAGGNYVVSFGAYATAADADMVIARLKRSDLPGFREQATVNGRSAWRVRIGPYADRAQAEIVRLQAVKVRSDVNTQVIALDAVPAATPTAAAPPPPSTQPPPRPAPEARPPAASASMTPTPSAAAPAEPAASAATGFVVQLGAFASADDANALRDKARAAGFTAFVEQVRTDNGMLNRVRVGPMATRAEAETVKASVAAKMGIDGMVRQHP